MSGASGKAAALVAAYLDELAVQRRLSRHTCEGYGRDLRRLLDYASGRPLDSLAAADIRRAVAQLHGRGLSGRSLARALSAWRSFFRWMLRHRHLAANPCQGLRAPKAARALPAALSPDQANALLDADPGDELEVRDRAMFELFYSSGLRLSELAGLDVEAGLDLQSGEVQVTGKRSKTRTVPVGQKARQALSAWLEQRVALVRSSEPALFVSRRGTRLSVRTIQLRLERWATKQGLGVRVHPHVLRHSFAMSQADFGCGRSLRELDRLRRSASAATSRCAACCQHLAKVYDAAHPRAKKR